MLTLGLIINPYAGIGGAVGLKGSDGPAIVSEALARGAQLQANERAKQCLALLTEQQDKLRFICPKGLMGADVLAELGFTYQSLPLDIHLQHTSAADTQRAALALLAAKVDLILFVGGDGTARDICAVVDERIPVLGIPAGVKIHSGVYGVSPRACAEVVNALLQGQLVDIRSAEVRDLDEEAFRHNQVRAKHYGEMRVPQLGYFVQAVKQGGVESKELVVADIAAYISQELEPDTLYFIGSGKTTAAIMDELGLPSTLLGVDAVLNHELIAEDLTAEEISTLLAEHSCARAILSVMGGQGHIIGRGNQQFTAAILKRLGKENIILVSAKSKISALAGKPLFIDSSDPELDAAWRGTIEIITGFNDHIVYPLS